MAFGTVTLNTGAKMPLLGLGLWKIPNDAAADVVYDAIKVGYRLFDGAAIYGNEKEVGNGFARALKEGIVEREDLFIISKLWCTFHDPERVEEAVKYSLRDLGVDYLDLYYIHFPYAMEYVDPKVRYPNDWTDSFTPGTASLESTWRAMENIYNKGLVRAIGITNYLGATLADLLKYAKVKPAVLQLEHHPYLTQETLVKFAQDNGLQVTAYSSLGPLSFIELDLPRAKDMVPLLDQSVVKQAAQKHGKSAAQVLLRWSTQRGIAVIPKSTRTLRLQENLDAASFDLAPEEIQSISALDKGIRFNDPLDDGVPIPVFV